MNHASLLIQIDWPWALGIIGVLITVAWKGSGRFKAIETNIGWLIRATKKLEDGLDKIKEEINKDISDLRLLIGSKDIIQSHSPINLTTKGENILNESGLKNYIDEKESELVEKCASKKNTNPYEVQEFIFDLFRMMEFDDKFDDELKKYAFSNGLEMDVLRRVGAIYFRDLCLQQFDMKVSDIDDNVPEKV